MGLGVVSWVKKEKKRIEDDFEETTGVSIHDVNSVFTGGISGITQDIAEGNSIGGGIEDTLKLAGDPAGEFGIAPTVEEQFNAFSGKEGRDAQEEAAAALAEAGLLQAAQTRLARDTARADLQPFTDLGLSQVQNIGEARQSLRDIESPNLSNVDFSGLANQQRDVTGRTVDQLGNITANTQGLTERGYGMLRENMLGPDAANSDVMNSEFMQALMAQTGDVLGNAGVNVPGELNRQATMLQDQFEQNDLTDRLRAQDQKFNNLRKSLNVGLGAQQLAFDQTGQAGQFNADAVSTLSNQLQANQAGMNQVQQQGLTNEIDALGQQFAQGSELLKSGQRAAVGQSAATSATGASIIDQITQMGNAQAAARIGGQQSTDQGTQNIISAILAGFGI